MRLTNKFNLPQPIVDAVANDSYSKSDADISVTELLNPPQMRALMRKHEHELEEDASDRIWSLYGQVVHGILERAETTAIAERRLFVEVNGWKLSGGMDRFTVKTGILQDYKFTTAYKVKNGVLPEEWIKQLNIYAHILRENGEDVKSLQIVALYRDWSKLEAQRNEDYPQSQVEVFDIPLHDPKDVAAFVEERVRLHQAAEQGIYPSCTKEERWARPDQFAVMREGQKRAVRLLATEDMAQTMVNELGPKHYIQSRPGQSVRCAAYCAAARFCNQYKKENE